MSGKRSAQIFQKRHFDTDRFITDGASSIADTYASPLESSEALSEPTDRAGTGYRATPSDSAPSMKSLSEKPRKIAMTYKHRETHYDRLKWLSQRLKTTMGDLIDEALEAKFAEWRARVPPEPEF